MVTDLYRKDRDVEIFEDSDEDVYSPFVTYTVVCTLTRAVLADALVTPPTPEEAHGLWLAQE